MSMEDVLEKLRAERDQLTLQIDVVDQMIAIARGKAPRHQGQAVAPKARSSSSKAADARKRTGPATLEKVKKAIEEIVGSGETFVSSIPGSFSTAQVTKQSGLHEGTTRKAIQKLIDDGEVKRADRLSWRQLGDTPRGRTDVFVFNTPRRQWGQGSEGGGEPTPGPEAESQVPVEV